MITPMRKVTILALASEQEATVSALRDLGVLHVELRPAMSADADSARTTEQLDTARKAIEILQAAAPTSNFAAPAPKAAQDAGRLAAQARKLNDERQTLSSENSKLAAAIEHQKPFGNFDPKLARSVITSGIEVNLFRVPAKTRFPDGEQIKRLSGDKEFQYGVSFGELPQANGLELIALPEHSLDELRENVAANEERSRQIQIELRSLSAALPQLETHTAKLEEQYGFERVSESLSAQGEIQYLEGYCPVKKISALEEAARKHGWALWEREPEADDNVPVELQLPRWLRPITVLFKGLGILPGYREADVSAVFLLFFSLFFAILIGDAGYGLLMLAAVLFARRKKPAAPSQPFWLFGVFAVCTIAWGVLTGSYFALDTSSWPKFFHGLEWLDYDKNDGNVMWLCFLIGGVHLTIAHLWNALILAPSRKALAEIGWVGVVWLMFFLAGKLVVGKEIAPAVLWMGGLGILLIVLFMTDPKDFKNDWINHPMLILNLISCLVDVISYIRLFAVGMASAQIALTFNQMAFGMEMAPWLKPLVVALILILGHGLNLILGTLSILVHAVRLNTLEFSNHKGLTWSGQPYDPFKKQDKSVNA